MKKYRYEKSITDGTTRYRIRADSKTELAVKVAEKRKQIEEGKVTINNAMTVREWTEIAIKVYKTGQKPVTRETFVRRVNHCILEEIGHMKLKSVKPLHCQNVLNLQMGKSATQVKEVYSALKFIFKTAVDNKLIAVSPAENMQRPIATKGNRRSLTEQERLHFLKVCDEDPRFILFELMYYCGCRPSEAMEVRKTDISVRDGQPLLHIRGTKTVKSDRYVPMPDDLYSKIKKLAVRGTLAVSAKGEKHTPSSYRNLCKALNRAMNISMGCRVHRNQIIPPYPLADDFVPYNLRHTFCTDLQKKGVDIRLAQYLMGHSDIQMTANVYTHIDLDTVVNMGIWSNKNRVSTRVSTLVP